MITEKHTKQLVKMIRNRRRRFDAKKMIAIIDEVKKSTVPAGVMVNEPIGKPSKKDNGVLDIADFFKKRYMLRFNTIMGYVEYKRKDEAENDWKAVDQRVANGFTLEAIEAGMSVWDKDIRRYLDSNRIEVYNPVMTYIDSVRGKWDGRDHIGMLASRVKTKNKHWRQWFSTWLLAMVAQWMGKNNSYGNSVAPLFISGQGYNKSTFCRMLLPKSLMWGYCDNLSAENKKQMMQSMSEMLLINLDEFNQISKRIQEGFLKNLLQLPTVKGKRPYGKHVEDFPRLASFVATTNNRDVLTDPTGNRRFIAVELTEPIDVTGDIDHNQLYAQIVFLLDNGARYWFDDQQTQMIMDHNRQYQLTDPSEMYFNEMFSACDDEAHGYWRTAAYIHTRLRKCYGSVAVGNNLLGFGRKLANIGGLQRRRSKRGTEYLVAEKC